MVGWQKRIFFSFFMTKKAKMEAKLDKKEFFVVFSTRIWYNKKSSERMFL